ncbi:lys-63-specific deubiquitinase BRCC36-like [Phoenix dactylifera]|uniref:Lys-63-specific deubiquitinase BRCC36-like n=1 Tax=Phoenix dactylifera TaxID=42345 RepID=A0A8B9A4H4_PHODC|nr:lys-63-specific deubiquitinase BRCC36-like [Phoenix dactylifera]
MSLACVKMSEEVWLTCLTHALTTETEEIMGLLLGDIQYMNGGNAAALIWGASPQMRSDRRKDRVETNPELLAAASAQAERMTLTTGRTTRVIGWYHSHPHITVLPSHVDVRTQAMYQLLDPGFIGLIFSCFSEDAQKIGRIQVIAFQSLDGKQRHVSPVTNSSIIELESSWSSSENMASTSGSALTESFEQDTGDSRASKATKVGGRSSDLEEFFSHADVSYLGKQRARGNSLVAYNANSAHNMAADVDSPDMTPSMQEALHRSNLDMSGAQYIRKEVPLQVLPARYLLKLDSPLTSFTDMQHVLFEEERFAYSQAISQNMRGGKMHPLTFVHHTATYQASLCKLMEYCLSPAVNALQDRLKENEIRLALLMEEAKLLEAEAVCRDSEMNSGSPRRLPSHGVRGNLSKGQREMHASSDSGSVRSPSGIGSRRKAF